MDPEISVTRRAGGQSKDRGKPDRTPAPVAESQNSSSSPLCTPEQASAYLAVSIDTLARWRTNGKGPRFLKFTRARQGIVRYRREDLDRFIADCLQAST